MNAAGVTIVTGVRLETLSTSAPPTLQIGIDATCWHQRRGYGRHARSLITALLETDPKNRYTLFADGCGISDLASSNAKVQMVEAGRPAMIAASARGHRRLPDLARISRAMSAANLNVLLFPNDYSYVPVFSRAKKIVFVHDVIADIYPELTHPGLLSRFLWKVKSVAARSQADAIVAVSDYSRRRVIERFGLAPARVFVCGEASAPIFRPIIRAHPERLASVGLQPNTPFIVYVGGFGPHKNVGALVAAFAELVSSAAFSETRLVLVGECENETFHSEIGAIRRAVRERGLEDRIIFTGFLEDQDLVVLLNAARALVLPSLMEGFGLPAIEGAACGCPVIATRESPLPALLGDAAIYFNPHSTAELIEALQRVFESAEIRARMRRAGIAAAARLSWNAAARDLLNVIEAVARQ